MLALQDIYLNQTKVTIEENTKEGFKKIIEFISDKLKKNLVNQ